MDRYKLIRYFAYIIEILVMFMVQETPGLLPPFFGARPVLLIPAAVSIAMFESEFAGIGIGLLCGLFIDFGMGGVLGFHGLLLASFCYLVGILTADLIQTNFLTAILLGLASVGVILFLQWVFFFLLYGYDHSGYALVQHYLPRMAYSFFAMPLCYFFNRALALQIRGTADDGI
ncbi:rod shape-determining protein MreD [Clostridium sp. D33t1_170424_F3]|uniref:rod shape-determining protein MreD n=1 Tax=Clostridium sp. D33t1_170424_F3 TaxID=2787099 RepID=UPI001A9B377A|nr:rod shape-determining protein MreD [Clostridium sp. D33t1_170424_F3]